MKRFFVLFISLLLFALTGRVTEAVAPITVLACPGNVQVDGNTAEWSPAYVVASLYNAGDPTKAVFGTLKACYLSGKLYVLVEGPNLIVSPNDDWGTLNGSNHKEFTGNSPAGVFNYTINGSYEAVMTVTLNCEVPVTVQVHAENNTDGVQQTAALGGGSPTSGLPFLADCRETVPTPTDTATTTPTDTPTATPTETPTNTPTPTDPATPTETATEAPKATPTPTETFVPTDVPTETATVTLPDNPALPTRTPTPTAMASPTPTASPTVNPPTGLAETPEPKQYQILLPIGRNQ